MGRCGENSGRWKLEIMQGCWERTGVRWENSEMWGTDRGAAEVLKGVSQEAMGKQDDFVRQDAGVVILNRKNTLEQFFTFQR